MPKRDVIVNLPGFAIKKIKGYDPVVRATERLHEQVFQEHTEGIDLAPIL